MEIYAAQLGQFILIPIQLVFLFPTQCWMLSRDAANTNFMVFQGSILRLVWPLKMSFCDQPFVIGWQIGNQV